MRFYDALQLNPGDLKAKIRGAQTKEERRKMQAAMLVRSVLIVLFSIVLIAPISALFGPENNAMAVSLICILLSVRFVDFGYCIRDSLRNLAIVFFLLLMGPAVASGFGPLTAAVIHFLSFFVILTMTSDKPEMGNGGLYAFSYIFLVGNPVVGEAFWKRAVLTVLCFILCGAIFFVKHREKNRDIRFRHVALSFDLTSKKSQWQLQLALGVSLLLFFGDLLHLERMMWAGFACASLLGCYSGVSGVKERFTDRMIGAVVGSALFAVIYQLTPVSLHGLFGPVGGICLGFCTEYRYKTALNCLGALLLATGLYGLHGSIFLRILNNFLGAAFGYGFFLLYQLLVTKHFEKREANI